MLRDNDLTIRIEIETDSGKDLLKMTNNYPAKTLTTSQMDELCKIVNACVISYLKFVSHL